MVKKFVLDIDGYQVGKAETLDALSRELGYKCLDDDCFRSTNWITKYVDNISWYKKPIVGAQIFLDISPEVDALANIYRTKALIYSEIISFLQKINECNNTTLNFVSNSFVPNPVSVLAAFYENNHLRVSKNQIQAGKFIDKPRIFAQFLAGAAKKGDQVIFGGDQSSDLKAYEKAREKFPNVKAQMILGTYGFESEAFIRKRRRLDGSKERALNIRVCETPKAVVEAMASALV